MAERAGARSPRRHPYISALAASLLLATARAGLAALHHGYLEAGLWSIAARSFRGELLAALGWCLGPHLVWAWTIDRGSPRILRWAAALLALGVGVACVGFRLPHDPLLVPGFESLRGRAANAAALVSSLAVLGLQSRRLRTLRIGATGVAFSIAGLVGATWLWTESGPARWPERPNVILISLDTTRASDLGCYGYQLPTTPCLDRFAERSARFERAFAPYPWTLLSHGTLLTGLPPTAHGVLLGSSLPPEVPTLARSLARAGYPTLALVDPVRWMSPEYGLDSGFDLYRQVPRSRRHASTLPTLEALGRGPFALFLHFYDAHSDTHVLPYDAPPEDIELLARGYEGDFTGCDEELGCASLLVSKMGQEAPPPTPGELEYIRRLYDAGLRGLDRELGRIFDYLERTGLDDTTVVVVTADHGEAFFEHGYMMHKGMWDESIHVPLLIHTPDMDGSTVIPELVSLEDVAPTILDLCGQPTAELGGHSLLPLLEGDPRAYEREVVLIDDGRDRAALRTDGWKLIRGWKDRSYLYDLRADPLETHDLIDDAAHAATRARLEARLDLELERAARIRATFGERRWDVENPTSPGLAALGYAGLVDDDAGE